MFESYTAKIVEVLDGDAVKIAKPNGDIKYIRLIGINAQGYDLAFNYLNNDLLGKSVSIMPDGKYPDNFNIWNHAYIYANGRIINELMLEKGYAKIDDSYLYAQLYKTLSNSSAFAQKRSLGLWEAEPGYNNKDYFININTATRYILTEYLIDIDDDLANEIIDYRRTNDFYYVSDILNVTGFTRDLYYKNLYILITKSDINTATFEELISLGNISDDEADNIIKYRQRQSFKNTDELFKKNFITKAKFDKIKNYIK